MAVFAAALLLCALFFAEGCLFIPRVGMQEDEVQFVGGIFRPLFGRYFVDVGDQKLPLMIATYAGGLKALAYIAIFEYWVADVWSLRIPVLLLGTATVFLFFVFFRMTIGGRAALIATAIVACDPIFVVTSTLDFGIVAVQHFLASAALPLFVLYHRTRRRTPLALACFLCGLALWDKATFIWILAGLAAGLFTVFYPELRGHLKPRRVLFAAIWVLLGALPFLYYNAAAPSESASGMGGFRAPGMQKARVLLKTLDGSSLFGFLTGPPTVREDRGGTRVERAAMRLSRAAGHPGRHVLLYASLAGLALLPWIWRSAVYRRAVLFSAVAFLAGWLAMLPFAMGSGGSHHVILLWPLPQMLVAAALCAAADLIPRAGKAVAVLVAGAIALSGLLVTNEYYAWLVRFGAADHWSDAVNPLHALVAKTPAGSVYPLDWGIGGPLRTMGEGSVPLKFVPELLAGAGSEEAGRKQLELMLGQTGNLFIYYVNQEGKGDMGWRQVRDVARERGFAEKLVAEIPDRHGRPVYRVVQYAATDRGD